ncbi:hypothetical protein O181_094404 [Austropuccinia psidii MF-1]|uniref:Uncharacterized protein n=1 Tax=Austropuccinia psidii MF-1 TaxID=1389203 RepID=A0A9Q3PAS9_9BASI|nr:hypothetical protein [Austropuccinia psidii MF-1]
MSQYEKYYTVYKDKDWEMLPQIYQGVMNSWHILINLLKRGGNSEILQWMESTIIQASNQKEKGVPCQKEGGKQGRSPSSFYQQASSQPTFPRREAEQEKELQDTIFPKLQDSKNPKDAMDNVFNMAKTLM